MIELSDMTREELLEVIKIKDIQIKELQDEIIAYEQLVKELIEKLKS